MKPVVLKVARIGNSRGVRIPAETLERYGVGASLVMEERSDGILLRRPASLPPKLSWEETADEMVLSNEEWTAWDALTGEGLDQIPWAESRPKRVAEQPRKYNRDPRPEKQ